MTVEIPMRLEQVESFSRQFGGDRTEITWDGKNLIVPDALAAEVQAVDVSNLSIQLKAYANAKQWTLATGGFSVTIGGNAYEFNTDTVSQGLISRKALRFEQPNPPASTKWQLPNGSWLTIAATDFITAAIAIADFVQSTFDALEAVEADIDTGTITDIAGVDAYVWPANN